MQRRAFLGLSLATAFLAASAAAQPRDGGMVPPPPADQGPTRQPRQKPRLVDLDYDRMTARQKRKLQQRLAGEGNPPLPAEEARRVWAGMDRGQRRSMMRQAKTTAATQGGTGRRRAQMAPSPPDSMPPQ